MTDQHVSGMVAGPEGLREPHDFNALAMVAGANMPIDPQGQSRAVQTEDGMSASDGFLVGAMAMLALFVYAEWQTKRWCEQERGTVCEWTLETAEADQ